MSRAEPASTSPPPPHRAETLKGERFVFIDGLRGLAALAVAMYHIERYGPLAEPASTILQGPSVWLRDHGLTIERLIEHGWMGVQVFFVISGFVIAYSLRGAWVTPGFLGNYALRRALRLDPPYWTTIAFALALHLLGPRLLGIPSPLDAPPTRGQIASHALYLQGLLGYDNLSVGFWTLCIEVQFYLLYTTMLGMVQRCCGEQTWRKGKTGGLALALWFAPIAVVSLFLYDKEYLVTSAHDVNPLQFLSAWLGQSQESREALAAARVDWLRPFTSDVSVFHFFWMFFLGMLIHWTLEGRTPRWLFWSYVALMAARYVWYRTEATEVLGAVVVAHVRTIEIAVAGLAGVAIFVIGQRGRLGVVGNYRPLQFLGRISYSLYLIHYPVSHVIVNWGHRLTGDNPWAALAWTLLSLAAAIAAGYLLYIGVERPSLRFAARFRRPGKESRV